MPYLTPYTQFLKILSEETLLEISKYCLIIVVIVFVFYKLNHYRKCKRQQYLAFSHLSTEALIDARNAFYHQTQTLTREQINQMAAVQELLARERSVASGLGCLANRDERAIAKIIDVAVAYFFWWIASLTLVNNTNWFLLLLPCLYLAFADGLPHGQSIGKKLMGLAVITTKNHLAIGFMRAFLRNSPLLFLGLSGLTFLANQTHHPFTFLTLLILDFMFMTGYRRQRLGDFVARTQVIKTGYHQQWLIELIKITSLILCLIWLIPVLISVHNLFGRINFALFSA